MGGMSDPLGQHRLVLYTRLVKSSPGSGDRPHPGLFTRPPVLAAAEETAGAAIAVNLACRVLMTGRVTDDEEGISMVAEVSGFQDLWTFVEVFRSATGWHPLEWYRRFRSD
jgi:AraC-like DNA-binding protein